MRKRILLASALVGAIVCALAAPGVGARDRRPAVGAERRHGEALVPRAERGAERKVTEIASQLPDAAADTDPDRVGRGQAGLDRAQSRPLKLAKPLVTDDGDITDIVSQIDWKAKTAADGIDNGSVRRVHDRRRRPARQREPGGVQGDPDLLERRRRALDRSRSRRAVPPPSTRPRSSSSRIPTGSGDAHDRAGTESEAPPLWPRLHQGQQRPGARRSSPSCSARSRWSSRPAP